MFVIVLVGFGVLAVAVPLSLIKRSRRPAQASGTTKRDPNDPLGIRGRQYNGFKIRMVCGVVLIGLVHFAAAIIGGHVVPLLVDLVMAIVVIGYAAPKLATSVEWKEKPVQWLLFLIHGGSFLLLAYVVIATFIGGQWTYNP